MLAALFDSLGLGHDDRLVTAPAGEGPRVAVSVNPATLRPLAGVRLDDAASADRTIARAAADFRRWREVPAPVRGQVVRAIGDELRRRQDDLANLITLEVGKVRSESRGEVREAIDVADYAVGLSRQLYGLTMPSERAGHRIMEQWHPLGPVGVITAFNFPVAVWAWNALIAAVCGDVVIWKPSLLAPLTALATHRICSGVAESMGHAGVFHLLAGSDAEVASRLVADRRVPLISATGSCRMGREVGRAVADRLGRCLLELGGNNGVIVEPDADLDLAVRHVFFAAVGTAGQRCTSTRRLFLHESIAEEFLSRLAGAYDRARIGDPMDESTLVGPLISESAVAAMGRALDRARAEGGTIVRGGGPRPGTGLPGHFVTPAIVRAPASGDLPVSRDETFAPILYVFTYRDLAEAVERHNDVPQGLSSAIFTSSLAAAERFGGPAGSDCGMVSINLGTSGAEIGGAFGGDKDTGWGRESGSDSWKAYMRRQTCTIGSGREFTLAQGIRFEL